VNGTVSLVQQEEKKVCQLLAYVHVLGGTADGDATISSDDDEDEDEDDDDATM
jgi:hypothetical protein